LLCPLPMELATRTREFSHVFLGRYERFAAASRIIWFEVPGS
jgi:hypothetical protein